MEKGIKSISIMVAAMMFTAMPVSAMHIMEGFLPVGWSITWGALCLPFLIFGFFSLKKKVAGDSRKMLLLAMCGAFAFVLSALKMPSVSGSCSHPTGVGLGAILFGPLPMVVIGGIVLLFQATLLAHGGVTTLGANIFSMAIVGPFVSYGAYVGLRKLKANMPVAVFVAAFLGDMATYITTSLQLGAAFPDATGGIVAASVKFLSIFAVTQLPIAVCEGLLTVIVFNVLKSYSDKEVSSLLA